MGGAAAGGKGKKKGGKGKGKGKKPDDDGPVDVDWLAKAWPEARQMGPLQTKCSLLNKKVKIKLAAATSGFIYFLTLVKPRYPIDPIGALLELINSPLGDVGMISPKKVLNTILNVGPIQNALQEIRKVYNKYKKAQKGGKKKK